MNTLEKFAHGFARTVGGLFHLLKWLLYTIVALCVVIALYYVYNGGFNVYHTITSPLSTLTAAKPIPVNLPEVVSDDALKCRTYSMLADFTGAPHQYQVDKTRILRTLGAHARLLGVDECDIFHRQLEMTSVGSDLRQHSWIPDRKVWYIEEEFPSDTINSGLLLAKSLTQDFDPAWKAVVIIRPHRSWTFGNQSQREIDEIESQMEEVHVDGPTDFRFFKIKDAKK